MSFRILWPLIAFLIVSCSDPVGDLDIDTTPPPTGPTMKEIDDLTSALQLADINRDGRLDLIVGNETPDFYLYINDGSAVPFENQVPMEIEGATFAGAIQMADFDGDDWPDLAIGQFSSPNEPGPALIYSNQLRDPWFDSHTSLTGPSTGSGRVHLAAGDLDGDSHSDLVVIHSYNTGGTWDAHLAVKWFRNAGSNPPLRDANAQTIDFVSTYGQDVRNLWCRDMNGDGSADLLVARGSNEITDPAGCLLYLNDGSGHFSAPEFLFADPGGYAAMDLGDFDGDGDLDVAAAADTSMAAPQNRLIVWLNNGDGLTWTRQDIFTAEGLNIRAIKAVDMDGDERLDLVLSTTVDLQILLAQASAQPFSNDAKVHIALPEATTIAAGDLNNDGRNDLVLGRWNAPNQVVLNSELTAVIP